MKPTDKSNPSIYFVIGSLETGGSESQLVLLAQALLKKGWRVNIYTLEAKGTYINELSDRDCQIHDGGYRSEHNHGVRIVLLAVSFFRLLILLVRDAPDVLHCYLPLTNFLGALAGQLAGIKTVITSRRALGTHQDRYKFWKPFDRIANILSHKVTVNSKAVYADTIKRDRIALNKLYLIYNGIDSRKYALTQKSRSDYRRRLNLQPNEISIVSVANLIPYKGHRDILLALKSILTYRKDIKIFFIGEDRGVLNELLRLSAKLMIADQIFFLGLRSDVADLLSAMDIFVSGSHEEGFSNAIIEAMSASLPVIATDVGGNREALQSGKFGILVPPGNSHALAEAIESLINEKEKRLAFGNEAREYVQRKFSIKKMVQEHLNIYRN